MDLSVLNLLIEKTVEETLNEALRKFNLSFFKKLHLTQERINYAAKNLPALGRGLGRNVYAISNSKVLKVATSESGFEQNEAEVSIFTHNKDNHLVTKIYDFDPKYAWVISELVKEFGTEEKFQEVIGLDAYFLYTLLTKTEQDIENDIQKKQKELNDFMQSGMAEEEPWKIDQLNSSIRWFKTLLDDYQIIYKDPKIGHFVADVRNMTKTHNLDPSDVAYRHFGQNLKGEVKFFDYGGTEAIMKKHYSRIKR